MFTWHQASILRAGLFVVLCLVLPFQPATKVSAAESPPDLAALVVRPSDLETIGLSAMSVHRSILADRPRQAAEFIDDFHASYESTPPIGTAIRRSNPNLTYIQYLRTAPEKVIVTLMAFPGNRDAERGMAAYLGTIEDWLGEDAGLLDLDGVDAASTFQMALGGPYRAFNVVVFQQNAMVVVIQAWNNDKVADIPVEEVAALQRDRLDRGETTGISGLVAQGLRLRAPGWNTYENSYYGIEGEAIRRFYEYNDHVAYETRQENMHSAGEFDIHRSLQIVYGNWDSWSNDAASMPTATLSIEILGFEPEIGAWTPERIRTVNDDFPEVAVPIDGYESYGMFVDAEVARGSEHYIVWVWLDENTVIIFRHLVEVEGAAALGVDLNLDIEATNDLILHQIACFEGTRSCDTTIRSPYTYGDES